MTFTLGTIVALAIVGVLILGSVTFALTASRNEVFIKRRLDALESKNTEFDDFIKRGDRKIEDLPMSERIIYPYIMRLSDLMHRLLPKHKIDELNKKLIIAGNPRGMTAREFLGIQGLFGIALPSLSVILFILIGTPFGNALLMGVIFGAGGFILPRFWLSKAVTKRQSEIQKSLPFTLDLLNISVDAGLGFDSAMDKVANSMEGPISEEFNRVLSEIRLGKSRRDALQGMIERTDVPELNQFVVAVIQADRLGVGLGRLLKAQSKSMRLAAKQRAQEKAFQAPVKMLFPMILFIFPSIFIVLLGPAVIYLPEVLSGL